MNRIIANSIIIIFAALLFGGCVSSSGNHQDNFGYKRPEYKEPEPIIVSETYESNDEWINPLSSSNINYSWTNSYYAYRTPVYVPVIVPWWAGYYDWMGYPYWRSGLGIYVSYGGFYDWNWYCPWYNYHPYYGDYWYAHHYYNHWYHHPIYDYHKESITEQKKNRTFGPSRGSFVNADSKSSIGNSSQINRTNNAKEGSTNWKTIYDPKNENSKVNRTTKSNADKPKEVSKDKNEPNRSGYNPTNDNTNRTNMPKATQKEYEQPKPAKKSDFEYDNKPNNNVNREKPKETNKGNIPEYKREAPKEYKQSEPKINRDKAPEYKREAPKEYKSSPEPRRNSSVDSKPSSNSSGNRSSSPSGNSTKSNSTPEVNRTPGNRTK